MCIRDSTHHSCSAALKGVLQTHRFVCCVPTAIPSHQVYFTLVLVVSYQVWLTEPHNITSLDSRCPSFWRFVSIKYFVHHFFLLSHFLFVHRLLSTWSIPLRFWSRSYHYSFLLLPDISPISPRSQLPIVFTSRRSHPVIAHHVIASHGDLLSVFNLYLVYCFITSTSSLN